MSSHLSSPLHPHPSSSSSYATAPDMPSWRNSGATTPTPTSAFSFRPLQLPSSPDASTSTSTSNTAIGRRLPSHLSRPRYANNPHDSIHARRSNERTPGPGPADTDSPTKQVWRAKFRERCRQQMVRDRARALAKSRGGEFQSFDHDELMLTPGAAAARRAPMIGSDDLPSSSDVEMDMDDEPALGSEMDEELIRRVMIAEYRRIKRQHEISGERELGWLEPDQVAYLEEEMRREERETAHLGPNAYRSTATSYSTAHTRRITPDPYLTPTKNIGPTWHPGSAPQPRMLPRHDEDHQPPEDMVDEDDTLYLQYMHHRQGEPMDDFDVTWDQDHEFEAQLASMPIP